MAKRKFGQIFSAQSIKIAAIFACLCLTACDFMADYSSVSAAADARGDGPPGLQPVVLLGGTDDGGDGFADWQAADGRPTIITGPQSAQHIWIAARMKNLWPKQVHMAIELFDDETGQLIKPGKVEVTISFAQDGDWMSYSGLPAFVKEPCNIRDRKLRAHLTLTDLYGATTTADAFITPKWDRQCP